VLVLAAVGAGAAGIALAAGSGGRRDLDARALAHRPAAASPRAAPADPIHSDAAQQAALRRLLAIGQPVYCGGPRGRYVAFTFDDGPGPYTRLVLAKLHKHHVRATFFVVGRNLALVPGALRSERAAGAVGDHTFTHPLLTSLTPGEVQAQLSRTRSGAERLSAAPVQLFRPPYGAHDATVDAIARRDGLVEVLWTVDSADSLGAGYRQIEHNVIAGMHPGAIILMHENHGQTVRALLGIFAALQRRHLRSVSVPQLLAADPPSRSQLRAGRTGCGPVQAALTSGN
jgi:peptidoglycan/xylan/chitin deacetylase (PgdA/CDA1 family)